MHGRMTLTRSAREIAEHFELERVDALAPRDGRILGLRYNITPTQSVLTGVCTENDDRGAA